MGHLGAVAHHVVDRVVAGDDAVREPGPPGDVLSGDAIERLQAPGFAHANCRAKPVAIALPFHHKVLTGFQKDEA